MNYLTSVILLQQKKQKTEKKQKQLKIERGTENSLNIIVDTTPREVIRFLSKVRKLFPGLTIQKAANSAQIGDILTIGSTKQKEDITLLSTKGKSLVVLPYDDYYLSNDVSKILRHIEYYYESRYELACQDCDYKYDCPLYEEEERVEDRKVCEVVFDGQFINNSEKVSIFKDIVKIGYNFYEIKKHMGEKVIFVGDNIYKISADKNNNKFLCRF